MYWTIFLLAFSLVVQQHMFSPVPNEVENPEAFDDVRELESLRSETAVKPNNTAKDDHADSPSPKVMSSAPNSESEPEPGPEPEGNPPTNSRSAIFRHRGITQAKKNKYMTEKNVQLNDGNNKFGGIQYSPSDLAAYVFSTGDEEGVAVAVEELVREGMMGRTDAINYLQDVKQYLNYLTDQYEQQKKIQEFKNRAYPKPQLTQRLPNPPREQFISPMMTEKREPPKVAEYPAASVVTTEPPHPVVIASTTEPKSLTHSASTTNRPKTDSSVMDTFKVDDLKRRLTQQADPSYDFTFEVIYKLANEMFAQSILKDDPVAEDTLSGLVAYLESEVGNKRISPEMKEKVLEVVSHALVDSLRDYERMMPQNRAPAFDEGSFYRHLAAQNGPATENGGMPESYRKLSIGGHNNAMQLSAKNNRPKSS